MARKMVETSLSRITVRNRRGGGWDEPVCQRLITLERRGELKEEAKEKANRNVNVSGQWIRLKSAVDVRLRPKSFRVFLRAGCRGLLSHSVSIHAG